MNVYIAWISIPGKGRGVVAKQLIRRGLVMEDAPATLYSPDIREALKGTELGELGFARPNEYEIGYPCSGISVSGLAERCNHSDTPNAEVTWHLLEDGLCAHLVALRDIEALEEITISYTDIAEYDTEGWAA